ncbi:MAG: endolytic transglycosylase MltG [Bacteroides sp.]|nr:endolytic transglycosylase MltG [Bacteroides sp.]
MKKKTRNMLLILLGVILAAGAAIGGTIYYMLFSPRFNLSETTYLYIDQNDTRDSVFYKLEQLVPSSTLKGFRRMADHYKYADKIRTGRYAIEPSDNNYNLYNRLARGMQSPVKLTINSVRTREDLARNLGERLMTDSTEIASLLYDPQFCEKMGYNTETILCMILPNTYEVYWNIGAQSLMERLQKEHDRFWNEERRKKAEAIGMTPTEVSILASIVDEETNVNDEKPVVAGLYLNRLKKGMLLQADPTVKFGLQDFALRRITNQHLQHDSPYNTYKYAGLPPGPIRIPSIQGINSVLDHSKHNYIYMCAKEDFSGRHNFAVTLSQHTANARRYHEALNKRNIYR